MHQSVDRGLDNLQQAFDSSRRRIRLEKDFERSTREMLEPGWKTKRTSTKGTSTKTKAIEFLRGLHRLNPILFVYATAWISITRLADFHIATPTVWERFQIPRRRDNEAAFRMSTSALSQELLHKSPGTGVISINLPLSKVLNAMSQWADEMEARPVVEESRIVGYDIHGFLEATPERMASIRLSPSYSDHLFNKIIQPHETV